MNPIQPLSTRREINVVEPVSPALEHVKDMLFRPFDLGRWFVIGFCAWLAQLGETGSGFGGNYNFGNHRQQNGTDFRHALDQARDYLLNNLDWIIPLAVVIVVFCLGLWTLCLWLNSRGKFMFLHCVALNQAEVSKPWDQFVHEGNSLFLFRLGLGLVGGVLTVPLLVVIAISVLRMVYQGEADIGGIMLSIGLGMAFLLVAILMALVHKFTVDFVVPVMFLRRIRCWDAWREFLGLLSAHVGTFALYILFQIVLGMAIGTLVIIVFVVTCCIACCLMALPFLGTVLLLPVLVFKRAYSLCFLAQFGPEYNVFPPAPPTLPAPGLPPMPVAPPLM